MKKTCVFNDLSKGTYHQMKKITALLLAVLMLIVCAAAAGCAENKDPAVSDDTEDITTAGTDATTERLPDPVPTSLDLGGDTVTFLVRKQLQRVGKSGHI